MILLTLLLVGGWAAQTPPPSATPDSATKVRWERVLRTTSDSLDRLGRAIATFRTDLDPASAPLVMQRAEQVQGACSGAHKALNDLHKLLASPISSKAAKSQSELRTSTGKMLTALTQCQHDWDTAPGTPARADTLKAWGPYRSAHLQHDLLGYVSDVRRFAKDAGFTKGS